ncbi:mucin-2 isoform X1 [Zeugodacus cucurbitae]|uniref:Chitin-binding type-2 domain-containing protein n=1 Tax=Zeugodacus cucurbitae TaxID=28588 RepID=A0A0A1X411_ZEUCU|nr:mucin-2 isoform X1 [Zeugodacus cucurbitae]XP_054081425.1 mucin-2 isoform X1 [Zeugodacus cucurbitae]XP_054081426.1 mucin-2 isoform X1 [Zeugodacus cucurbitae]XP_054081427.1 mucin-2 isoform X1 [Zeugodacus cucurbitae]
MFNHNWLTWPILIWLLTCCYLLAFTDGQSENAIGAHRVFDKTSFSCAGRPSGYYADVETGCQVYHMCDGLGRQFSYSCPNTTLFQQRMLICDHWYMVNCSRAESDYAANLLIGQRDKPFVNDEENSLRTPRPDLLDRPYAPDYSGESFRNQYEQFPAIQNQIHDSNTHKVQDKFNVVTQTTPGQQHWKIPSPSRTILPPAYEAQISDVGTSPTSGGNVRFVPKTTQPTPPNKVKTTFNQPKSSSDSATTTAAHGQSINRFNSAALHQRGQLGEHEDLGTSHSTRYNTSSDFNSAELSNSKSASVLSKNNFKSTIASTTLTVPTTPATTFTSTTTRSPTSTTNSVVTTNLPYKLPSKVYEPPFLYPIYNENDTVSTQASLRTSPATPFTTSTAFNKYTSTTPIPPPNRPTTLAGKPFTASNGGITTKAPSFGGRNQNNLIQTSFSQSSKDVRTPTPAQGFKPPTPRPPVSTTTSVTKGLESSPFDYSIPTTNRLHLPTPFINASDTAGANNIKPPAKELLPPHQEFAQHDIATTQGPPIYYEWKVPSNGLEPPKLDPPIGVDGREYPEAVLDYNTISGGNDNVNTAEQITKINGLAPTKAPGEKIPNARTPISRSIKETGQPNSVHRINAEKPKQTTTTVVATDRSDTITIPASDITQLRKDYSVPEYLFPLEPIGRTGYLSTDSYNSFRLKIPEHDDDVPEDHRHWFGENPKCPECHPSFVVPGTCEPCIRR